MKITWNWLAEYIDLTDLTPHQVAADLTSAGIPVEWMEPFAQGVEGVVVGEVLAAEPHPNADRLRVCQVHVGDVQPLTIVCGAANVAAGQRVPVAVVGSRLPSGAIGRSKLRGVDSQGMICSAEELGLPVKLMSKEQTDGIFVLPADAPIGAQVTDYLGLGDMVMDLELTPNRSDCLSLRGVAYEVGALYGRAVHMPSPKAVIPVTELPLQARVETPLCELYCVQAVRDVTIGPAPIWMQMRLLAVGVRPINNLVDITNYVMFEWGQPLHAFDYSAIAVNTLVVRQAIENEVIVTLDGQSRTLTTAITVIADPLKGLGLAGVMGGQNSEITQATSAVVIESAVFDPLQTRRTARQLQLRSEAGVRFEKGPDPAVVQLALARAVTLMMTYAGGQIASPPVIAGTSEKAMATEQLRVIAVSPARVAALLGCDFTRNELLSVCARLQFASREQGDQILVSVPSRRSDIVLEEDMIEEFARLLGYDRIPATSMTGVLTPGRLSSQQVMRRALRDHLIAQGLQEVWTYALVSGTTAARAGLPTDHMLTQMVSLLNPLSEERRQLRSTMLFSQLEVAEYNSNRRVQDIRLFEIGTVFYPHELPLTGQPAEAQVLACLLTGNALPVSPHGGQRPIDFFDAKGLFESVLQLVGIRTEGVWSAAQEPYFHSGQAADVSVQGVRIGSVGKLRASVAREYSLSQAYYMELDIEALVAFSNNRLQIEDLPRYPSSERDLALVAPRQLPVARLLARVREAASPYLQDVYVFDVYTGDKVNPTEKSVAIRLIFRAVDRTLLDEDVQEAIDRVIAAALELGVFLRA